MGIPMNLNKKKILLALVCTLSSSVFAQSGPSQLEVPADPLEAYKFYYGEAYRLYASNPITARQLGESALIQAENLEQEALQANVLFLLGLIDMELWALPKSYERYQGAVDFYEKLGNKEYALRTYWNLGIVMTRSGNLARGEAFFKLAETQITQFLSTQEKVDFYQDFGELYFQQEAYSLAIDLFLTAQAFLESDSPQHGILDLTIGKCWTYLDKAVLGDSLFRTARQKLIKAKDNYHLGLTYVNIGYQHQEALRHDSAVIAFEKALELTANLPDPSALRVEWYEYLSISLLALDRKEEAYKALVRAVEIITSLPKRHRHKSVLLNAVNLAYELGEPAQGRQYSQILAAYDDALNDDYAVLKALLLESDFQKIDAAQAEQDDETAKHNRQFWWEVGLAVFLLLFLSSLLWFWNRYRKDQKTIREQAEQIKASRERTIQFAEAQSQSLKDLYRRT
ncbi:MAG TPA: hypothetical protein DCR93_33410 [Cytophagales bacterium]|nr:hypothetical protein [Cytophagales bacterium]